ncbi:MAG: leucine-rich repeat domain-containing protein [Saprospiraceae bacterium]|nr:leucine-rich repeat domain-containing protein [Candidatus Vicinibacter affinis]
MEELRTQRQQTQDPFSSNRQTLQAEEALDWRNPFEGFPEAVCKLEQLEVLFADGCQLSVLPSSFASLRNLLELNLGDNAFEQFPEVICELRSLRKLWVNGNKLSSLPRSFANLRELRELDISNNRFKEFPSSGVRAADLRVSSVETS